MSANPKAVPQIPVDILLTERQWQMFRSTARVLWIGAGTKTGKTFANAVWIAEGILNGEPVAWCGPQASRTEDAYNVIKGILEYSEKMGDVRFNDSTKRVFARNGGRLETWSGENPQAIYGSGYTRFVIDEASRQTRQTLMAARSTVAKTRGNIHIAFNLDHGMANWAIRELVRIRSLSPAEREVEKVDFMLFPTLGEGFVDAEEIELARRSYPPPTFDALYNAIIPESDIALFRNLDQVFSAAPIVAPIREHGYVQGVDLARTQDWTVATVIDVTTKTAVDSIRFQHIDWTVQYERIADQYRRWRCSKTIVDQNGIGDPIVTELEHRRLNVEGLKWGEESRKMLLEELVIACDAVDIHVVNDERFTQHRTEMENFEYQLDKKNGKVKYAVAEGFHDDCVFSLALSWHGTKLGNFGRPRIARGDTSRLQKNDLWGF